MMDTVNKFKESAEEFHNNARKSFKKLSTVLKFIESKFVYQQVQGYRLISKDMVDAVLLCN